MPGSLPINSFFQYVIVFLITCSCGTAERNAESLARIHCSSCHLFPDPSLLDKQTWEKSVLPHMAFRMGLPDFQILSEINAGDMETVLKTIPPRPLLSTEQWESIRKYYKTKAPDSITFEPEIILDSITQFAVQKIQTLHAPLITMLKMDTLNHFTYVGTRRNQLYKLNNAFYPVDSLPLESPPSNIHIQREQILISCMGIMDPNDQAKGKIISVVNYSTPVVQIDSLKRPVHFETVDLNNDNIDDYVVCEFGNFTGELAIFDGLNNELGKHVISYSPGARKIIVKDFTRDGRMDILALMTQGDERVVLYTNEGDFRFKEKVLLRFPPVYGSSYMEIADFNHDGFFDLLLTNGDNADLSMIEKPYHAVRIFQNNGKNIFEEIWSFSMPGASMAMARDFDQDGDIDIAAIAFFPDFINNPERSFLYFENRGDNTFIPQTTSYATAGRWLTMETGDFDSDGDCDILLGAMSVPGFGAPTTSSNHWAQQATSMLLLENKKK